MRSIANTALMLCCAIGTAAAAESPTIYRCGNGQYSAQPCAGGVAVDAADERTAMQRQQAEDAARREAALATRLAAERRERERQATPSRAGSLSAAAPAPPASASRKRKPRHKHPAPPPDPRLSVPMRSPASSPGR